MKKIGYILSILLIACVSCVEKENTPVHVSSISIVPSNLSLVQGESATIKVSISPQDAANKEVKWSSDDIKIANVSPTGEVSALNVGTTIVTATSVDGGKTAKCTVIVTERKIPVSSITLDRSIIELEVGESTELIPTILPDDATDKSVSWDSDAPTVASVDQSGKVIALSSGCATISVKTSDGEKTAKCTIIISEKKIAVESITLSESSLSITEGDRYTLEAIIYPDDATNKNVKWSSDNPAVATIDSNGIIDAIQPGQANIMATTEDGDKSATCSIIVNKFVTEPVDLGLSVMWSNSNLGAKSQKQYGDYYAWGEIDTYYDKPLLKESISWKAGKAGGYSWQSYKWCNNSPDALTKYNSKTSYGEVDYKETLEISDDVAAFELGAGWRIPTLSEWEELQEKCTWTWENIDGVSGYKVLSKINGKSIFLAAGGYASGTEIINQNKEGLYASSECVYAAPSEARCVVFNSGQNDLVSRARVLGFSIRPVAVDVKHISEIAIYPTSLLMYLGSKHSLSVSISPSDAYNKSVIWSSSDENIATVNQIGDVEAHNLGSCIITVTTVDGGLSAQCSITVDEEHHPYEGDVLPGTFSVGGKLVQFTRGNLQATLDFYHNVTSLQFATEQYETTNQSVEYDNTYYSLGVVDRFGWSTNSKWGVLSSSFNKDYGRAYYKSGSDLHSYFNDWGQNFGSEYFTLSAKEWSYLLESRNGAESMRGYATITDEYYPGTTTPIKGVILLPEEWEKVPEGLSFKSAVVFDKKNPSWNDNLYSKKEWWKMEENGAVFLPAPYLESGIGLGYWTSTPQELPVTSNVYEYTAYSVNFGYVSTNTWRISTAQSSEVREKYFVRLVVLKKN